MKIIEEKNTEIDQLKHGDEIPEVIAARNDILQKEMLVLKVSLQQKDSFIKSLNELLERKEQYVEEVNQIKREGAIKNQKLLEIKIKLFVQN